MTRRLWVWWRRRHVDTTDEARAALEAAEARDDDVRRLSIALRELEANNHFSAMVHLAIARTRDA